MKLIHYCGIQKILNITIWFLFWFKIRGRTATHVHEQILDNMVGSGSQTIENRENAPMFKPEDNIQYSHGAPNMNTLSITYNPAP